MQNTHAKEQMRCSMSRHTHISTDS